MKTSLLGLALVSAVSILAGCSSGSSGPDESSGDGSGSFACDVVPPDGGGVLDFHRCAAFASMPADLRDGNCANDDQEHIVEACPTDGLIAKCIVPNENFGSITYYYYSDSTLDDAAEFCSSWHGTLDATH